MPPLTTSQDWPHHHLPLQPPCPPIPCSSTMATSTRILPSHRHNLPIPHCHPFPNCCPPTLTRCLRLPQLLPPRVLFKTSGSRPAPPDSRHPVAITHRWWQSAIVHNRKAVAAATCSALTCTIPRLEIPAREVWPVAAPSRQTFLRFRAILPTLTQPASVLWLLSAPTQVRNPLLYIYIGWHTYKWWQSRMQMLMLSLIPPPPLISRRLLGWYRANPPFLYKRRCTVRKHAGKWMAAIICIGRCASIMGYNSHSSTHREIHTSPSGCNFGRAWCLHMCKLQKLTLLFPNSLQKVLMQCCHNQDSRLFQAYTAAQNNRTNFFHNLKLAFEPSPQYTASQWLTLQPKCWFLWNMQILVYQRCCTSFKSLFHCEIICCLHTHFTHCVMDIFKLCSKLWNVIGFCTVNVL